MSSTKGNVNKDDYYATPSWIVEEFLREFEARIQLDMSMAEMYVLDPSCGGCSEHEAAYPVAYKKMYGVDIDTMDIREDSHANLIANYLETDIPVKYYDMIMTNPPFSLSVDFAEKALAEVKYGGYVVMLQRLNWLGSIKRKPFWDKMPLKAVLVHHRRPSFHGTKGTDSIEYAHFVFQKGYNQSAKLVVI
ncbi:putative DNA methyltransferase [Vibrio phage nt-1]|uniref:DNA methyltransferase n=1 Tax=Vibrio phage nt-1 TaxID=115992 RepID=R9TEK1_9CAUD|nr:DNA methyltransferase [Vibrio phage nt-1]AGN30186.1 putative DNA methyltransferase [Vibrio phage nt-1]